MFALLKNYADFEVSSLILESKLLLKLFFVRMTTEIIPLPLTLRTKRKLLSALMAGICNACIKMSKQETQQHA